MTDVRANISGDRSGPLGILASVALAYLAAMYLIDARLPRCAMAALAGWGMAVWAVGRLTGSWKPQRNARRVRRGVHVMLPCLILLFAGLDSAIGGRYAHAHRWWARTPTIYLEARSNNGFIIFSFTRYESPVRNYFTSIRHERQGRSGNLWSRWGFGWGYGTGATQFGPYEWIGYKTGWFQFAAWMPIILMLLPVLLWLIRLRRAWWLNHRLMHRRCLICGYDLRVTPDRCPECGTPVHADAAAMAGASSA